MIIDHGETRKSGRIGLRSYDFPLLEKVQIASHTIIMHLHIIRRSLRPGFGKPSRTLLGHDPGRRDVEENEQIDTRRS
jgi:hypothetical protein